MNKNNLLENVLVFRACPGMFILQENYENISSFIAGMDFSVGGILSSGFNQWLYRKYSLQSNSCWILLITHIYNQQQAYRNDIDFLFDNVIEYLTVKTGHDTLVNE
ncbi:hypothetical protein ED744_16425 [Escherichia coli]|uniref:hypothetical protein n=1 Tax=Escherichia sp. MOD1-EC4550 TaxID=2093861 RepID=UPI000CF77DE3|nr:hypothetical protein [Escherichia sp. MOD1-EC4550]EGO8685778.1 hypothetical protein [Escherichia coli]EGO8722072.1 hypothetical protein [Escherichia coli]EME6420983.1 hypothetical protein [Escherichia coli]MCS1345563.1 hypothetical protein [Escherichia coli]HAW4048383.1 hypothetical protein [Escherichia coli]